MEQVKEPKASKLRSRRPLRCVLVSKTPEQVPDFRKWIEEHRNQYTLKDVRSYPASRGSAVEPAISLARARRTNVNIECPLSS